MGPVTGILVYVILWWLTLMAVLPFGVRPPERPEPGHAPSAPAKPHLKLKFAATTLIAAVFWGVIYLIVISDLLTFRPMDGS